MNYYSYDRRARAAWPMLRSKALVHLNQAQKAFYAAQVAVEASWKDLRDIREGMDPKDWEVAYAALEPMLAGSRSPVAQVDALNPVIYAWQKVKP